MPVSAATECRPRRAPRVLSGVIGEQEAEHRLVVAVTFLALGVLLVLGIPIAISLLISGMLGYMLTIGFDPA